MKTKLIPRIKSYMIKPLPREERKDGVIYIAPKTTVQILEIYSDGTALVERTDKEKQFTIAIDRITDY